MDAELLKDVCKVIESGHGAAGRQASENLQAWLSSSVFGSHHDAILELVRQGAIDDVLDEFWRTLPFGTGGRRGTVGLGPNRINETTIGLTVQGHCNYLRQELGPIGLSVIVANDVREFNDVTGRYRYIKDNPLIGVTSRSLAKLACEIYAQNGICAYLQDPDSDTATLTTPELSFAIRQLGVSGGVNISASHNHPDDNGIKIYSAVGAQLIPPDDEHLAEAIEQANNVSRMEFAKAQAAGLVLPIPDRLHQQYVDLYIRQLQVQTDPTFRSGEPIVYTPLCGCGERTVLPVLLRAGFDVLVPEDQRADGRFSSIPFLAPNPEIEQATRPATDYASRMGATLVLSSDPDADRVGVDIAVDGTWRHLTGDQIAAVLAYYLIVDPAGPGRRGMTISTMVTTRLVAEISSTRGLPSEHDLLIGFKYVSDAIDRASLGSRRADGLGLVLGAEESHGVLTTTEIRDKDATGGAIHIAELHSRLRATGSNLLEYYEAILKEYGVYAEVGRSLVLPGRTGLSEIDRLMQSLRKKPLTYIDGEAILDTKDYWNQVKFGGFLSSTDRAARNVLQWESERHTVTIRPSGTEPKIKLYVHSRPGRATTVGQSSYSPPSQNGCVVRIADEVYRELLERLGRYLSSEARALPDVIPLAGKELFDTWIAPQLASMLESDDYDLETIIQWLVQAGSSMTPGADALVAMRQSLSLLADGWARDGQQGSKRLRSLVALIDHGS